MSLREVETRELERLPTGIGELDRALGGGLVAGQVVLLGGDPGIGKSTLLLQALAAHGRRRKTLYVTGEESAEQVALRARRLALDAARRAPASPRSSSSASLAALEAQRPRVAVIDSIQTLWSEALQSAPGSVAQVRECAAQLTRHAKRSRHGAVHHRPRHQGRRDRRAARARAHRRHGALLRGRSRTPASAWCAR